jgi:coenzyme Q-binding protein COQ10
MTEHRQRRLVAAPPETIFDLVADVERYPEFLSLWRSAAIYAREDGGYYTTQEVGLGPVRETFRTHTRLVRPEQIEVTSIDPLFRTFRIRWGFERATGGSQVSIALAWEVHSRLLQRAIDALLPATAQRMVAAFESRARQVERRRQGRRGASTGSVAHHGHQGGEPMVSGALTPDT